MNASKSAIRCVFTVGSGSYGYPAKPTRKQDNYTPMKNKSQVVLDWQEQKYYKQKSSEAYKAY
jgi:hypothetical protein